MTSPLAGSSGNFSHNQFFVGQKSRFQSLKKELYASMSTADSRMLETARALEGCAQTTIAHLTQVLKSAPTSQRGEIYAALEDIKSDYAKVYHTVLSSGLLQLSCLDIPHLQDAVAECEIVIDYVNKKNIPEALKWADKMRPDLQAVLVDKIKTKYGHLLQKLREAPPGTSLTEMMKIMKNLGFEVGVILKQLVEEVAKGLVSADRAFKSSFITQGFATSAADSPDLILKQIVKELTDRKGDPFARFKRLPLTVQESLADKIHQQLYPNATSRTQEAEDLVSMTFGSVDESSQARGCCQKALAELISELQTPQGFATSAADSPDLILKQIVKELTDRKGDPFARFKRLPLTVQESLADKIHQQLYPNATSRTQEAEDLVSMTFGSVDESSQARACCQKALADLIGELQTPQGSLSVERGPINLFNKALPIEQQVAQASENFEAVRASSEVRLVLQGYQYLLDLQTHVKRLDTKNSMKIPTLAMLQAQTEFLKERITTLIVENPSEVFQTAQREFVQIPPFGRVSSVDRMARNCDIIHQLAVGIGKVLGQGPIVRSAATTPHAMIEAYKQQYPYLEVAEELLLNCSLQTFPGLKNKGAVNCWANTLLQMMVTVPSLANIVKTVGSHYALRGESEKEQQAGRTLIEQIDLLTQSRDGHSPKSSADSERLRQALATLFVGMVESGPVQEDALNVLGFLVGRYEQIRPDQSLDLTKVPGFFKVVRAKHYQNLKAASGEASRYSSLGLNGVQQRDEVGSGITLNLSPLETKIKAFKLASSDLTPEVSEAREKALFVELVKGYFNPQVEEADTAKFIIDGELRECRVDGEQVRITHPPQEFMMSCNRFGHDRDGAFKLKHDRGLGEESEIKAPLFERFTLSAEYVGGADTTYEVDSFIVHVGELNRGHYYSYQKIEGKWYLFNDEQVRPASRGEIKDQLQLSYVQHYKKMEAVDPSAAKV